MTSTPLALATWAPYTKNIDLRPPTALRQNPRNARTHSKRQIQQVANSIKAVGFIGAIIIDEKDMVLAGHARLEAAKLLGMTLVPTLRVTGLSDVQKRAFGLAWISTEATSANARLA